MQTAVTEAARERAARQKASSLGLQIKKSRRQDPLNTAAPFMVVDSHTNGLVSDEHCTLDDVEALLDIGAEATG